MENKKKIRRIEINGCKYYVYDLGLDINGRRKRLYAKTEGELKELIEREEENRKTTLPDNVTLFEDLTTYALLSFVGNMAPSKINRCKSFLDYRFTDELKNFNIDTVSTADIDKELGKMRQTMTDELFNKVYDFVVDVIKFAHSFNRMPFVREDRIEIMDRITVDYRVTDKDYELLKKEILKKGSSSSYAIYLIMELGLRITEVTELKWDNLSDDYKTLSLSRRDTISTFKLDDVITNILKDISAGYPKRESEGEIVNLTDPDDYVFKSKAGLPLNTAVLSHHLQGVLRNCGASDLISLNDLREYRGEQLLKMGLSIEEVSEILGFSDPNYAKTVFADYINELTLNNALNGMNLTDEQKIKLYQLLKHENAKVNGKSTADVLISPVIGENGRINSLEPIWMEGVASESEEKSSPVVHVKVVKHLEKKRKTRAEKHKMDIEKAEKLMSNIQTTTEKLEQAEKELEELKSKSLFGKTVQRAARLTNKRTKLSGLKKKGSEA